MFLSKCINFRNNYLPREKECEMEVVCKPGVFFKGGSEDDLLHVPAPRLKDAGSVRRDLSLTATKNINTGTSPLS
ncbi:hypothetical protein GN956_G16864 [Arapaima gigas]